jgi:hypothetical protein
MTSLGDYAFEYCGSLARVIIPGSVTNIGYATFQYCGLTNVAIPGSVINFGDYAFYACSNLTSATIADGVTSIGEGDFAYCGLESVTVPGSVTSLGDYAFYDCTNLTAVYFTGRPPFAGADEFFDDNQATIYYLRGATGWGATYATRPVVLWNPLIETDDGGFGVRTNQFGFNITGIDNYTVVVEVCTNLAGAIWTPLKTVTLTNGLFHFSEPLQTNPTGRYYGLGLP